MRGTIYKRTHQCKNGRESVLYYAVVDTTKPGVTKRTHDWGRGHRTRKAAQADLLERLRHAKEPASRVTLGEYLTEQWLPQAALRIEPTTMECYRRALAKVLPRGLSHVPLRDLQPAHFNHLYRELREEGLVIRYGPQKGERKPLSVRSVRIVHAVLSKALNDAIDLELIYSNPATRALPPRQREVFKAEVWTPEELFDFLSYARRDPLYPALELAAATGMRRGEIAGLRWRDVNFPEATIAIREARTLARREIITTTPKNGQPRVVDVDPITLKTLADLQSSTPAPGSDDLVFLGSDDQPIHPDRLSQTFRRLLREGGFKPIRFHDLRHTHASMLLKLGVPIKVVSERLGHADPGFTMRTYQHVLPGMQAEAAKLFAQYVREGSKTHGV